MAKKMATKDRRVQAATAALTAEVGKAKSFHEVGERIAVNVKELLNADICTLWHMYQSESHLSGSGNPEEETRVRPICAAGGKEPQGVIHEVTYRVGYKEDKKTCDGVTGCIATERKTVLVNSYKALTDNFGQHRRGKLDPFQWSDSAVRDFQNMCGIPLILNDELVGILKVENVKDQGDKYRDITPADQTLLERLGKTIAVIVKSFVLLDHHDNRLSQALNDVWGKIGRFETTLRTHEIAEQLADALKADICSVWLVDESGTRLINRSSCGFSQSDGMPEYDLPVGYDPEAEGDEGRRIGFTAWVAKTGRKYWVNSRAELRAHPAYRGQQDTIIWGTAEEAEESFGSLYAIPLVWHGKVYGVLKVERKKASQETDLRENFQQKAQTKPKTKHREKDEKSSEQQSQYFTPADRLKCDSIANYLSMLIAQRRLPVGDRTLFISYCQRDVEYKEQFETFLAPLQSQGTLGIKTWSDQDIQIGANWQDEIDKRIKEAEVAVFLITPHFLASDSCMKELHEFYRASVELKQKNERERKEHEAESNNRTRSDERGHTEGPDADGKYVKHKRSELKLIGIVIEYCNWGQVAILNKMQMLPSSEFGELTPLLDRNNVNKEWAKVVDRLAIELQELGAVE